MRHVLRSLVQAVGLVVLVLFGAEAGLWVWNDGAFNEPNFYQLDDTLGLRLIPDSTMRLAYLGITPATDIHINSLGYRGPEHPPPAENDIVVVGDSLSFGMGVENEQTFSVRLQALLGDDTAVINYGVPSYGMHEQTLMVGAVLRKRAPRRVIYALSMGRFIGEVSPSFSGRIRTDNGWLIAGDKGNVQVPLPLPGPVMRFSHLVNLIRQSMRAPSRARLTRNIVEGRQKRLLEHAQTAADERARLAEQQWFELMGPDGTPRSWSRLLPELRVLKKAMADSKATLSLLLLTHDFVLHPEAWEKYGMAPKDMGSFRLLREDLVATAAALGIDLIDTTDSMQAAGPGTTLPRDWHFSPLGHQVIAETLAAHLLSASVSAGNDRVSRAAARATP